jgi:mannose-6-phosphate isomerase-like protein (cupin superfamily)
MQTVDHSAPGALAAAAPSVRVGSGIVTVLLDGDATGGAYTFFDELTDPGGGPPLHIHGREDEAYFIVDGRFAFQVGEHSITVGPGDFVLAPRGIPHTFRNLEDRSARKLALAWPAGMDRFFLEVGQPVDAEGAPEAYAAARFVETVAKYGMKILAPPA